MLTFLHFPWTICMWYSTLFYTWAITEVHRSILDIMMTFSNKMYSHSLKDFGLFEFVNGFTSTGSIIESILDYQLSHALKIGQFFNVRMNIFDWKKTFSSNKNRSTYVANANQGLRKIVYIRHVFLTPWHRHGSRYRNLMDEKKNNNNKKAMYKRPDSDYTRLKNTLAICVYCGEKFKYGSLKKHQKRKHAKQDPHPPIVKPGQVQSIFQ